MANLQSRTKSVRVIIDYPIANTLTAIAEDLSSSGFIYAMIVHDKDTKEDGTLKTKHIHLVLTSPKRHQLQYFLYRLSETFGTNTNQISIQVSESTFNDVQYLIHKNDLMKYQYEEKEIIHNFNSNYFRDLMDTQHNQELTIKVLISVIRNCSSRLDIMDTIGLQRYQLYRNVIKDIMEDLKYIEDMQERSFNGKESL